MLFANHSCGWQKVLCYHTRSHEFLLLPLPIGVEGEKGLQNTATVENL